MKTDLFTAVLAAIIGVVVAYFIVGGLFPNPDSVTFKTLETVKSTVDEPNPEIFNYRAINPTVETYIDCENYDLSGNCLKTEKQGD